MGLVQHASGSASSGSTVTATFSGNTVAGNTIIVCVSNGSQSSAITVTSVALTGSSDTFTKAVSVANATAITDSEIWYDNNNSSGHTVVTVTLSATLSGGSSAELDIYEWNGIVTTTPVDKTHSGTTNVSGTWSSGSSTALVQASEVAFGVTGGFFSSTPTITGPAAPWTNEPQVSGATGYAQLSGYQQVSATTALTYNGTITSGSYTTACIATFKLNTGVNIAGLVATDTVAASFGSAVVKISENTSVNVVPGAANAIGLQRPPAIPVFPGRTWRTRYKFLRRVAPAPAIGSIQPPYSPPVQPVSPGRAWKKRFGYPRRQLAIPYSSPTTRLPSIGIVVQAVSHSTVVSSTIGLFSVPNVSVIANFGSVSIKKSLPGSVSVSSMAGTRVTESGSAAAVSVISGFAVYSSTYASTYGTSTILGTLSVKVPLPGSIVTAEAIFGSTSITHPLNGATTPVSVAAHFGHTGQNISISVKNVAVASYFGQIKTNVPVSAASVSETSASGSKITLTGAGQNVAIYGEFGHIHAGNSQTNNPANVTISSHYGSVTISSRITGNVLVASSVHTQFSMPGHPANVALSAIFGKVNVSLNKTGLVTIAANTGTPKTSVKVNNAVNFVASKVSAQISPHVLVSQISIASSVHAKISVSEVSALVSSASVFSKPKISVPQSSSGIIVKAQKEGTNVGAPRSLISVQAHIGFTAVFYSVPSQVNVTAHTGTPGGFSISGHVINDEWRARIWP